MHLSAEEQRRAISRWLRRNLQTRYKPASLDEIQDYISSLVSAAPLFEFEDWWAVDRTIDSEFAVLDEALRNVRGELGEERFNTAVDLAEQAKALFVDDPEDSNGKTVAGCHLLWAINGIIEESYQGQTAIRASNNESQVIGD